MEKRNHHLFITNIYSLNSNFDKSLRVKVYNINFKTLFNKYLNYTQIVKFFTIEMICKK